MSDHEPTYSRCAVQLNLYSLIKVTGLIGLAGGISWALIICLLDMVGLIELVRFESYLTNLIAFPMAAAFFGVLFSIVGYPIYAWVCKNARGQKLSGIFHAPRN
ncbi:MAG: hypothetical protein AWU57_2554 [Marinobacter sp. T13-3]|jgi:hypothetical protein|nr:MAG: hypothetical protein AWU57_2554 [Marinobacter sp. T13-3]